ncbi:polysaccharide pyruvyl transferase family protein [uncultured Faecalicoccus sp.]|uniref:polysaccharide pyruvyl transferase family protein n=1 Tax=uncultured Faecalicoccus sp. TaxID=1971760 RepID=UPI00258798CA|nr:polysaccharide pyruvyl transferase family protein [uncultured Faecalicoccus sp.]
MKIELISMQRVFNHGSFLQAYALKKMLSTYADDVRFGDILPGISNDTSSQKFSEVHDIPKLRYYWIRVLDKIQIYKLKQLQRSVLEVDNHFSENENKDIAFIGSDEMFNCLAPSPWGISEQLFGKVPNTKRVYTYAVSCGHTTFDKVPSQYQDYLKSAISNIQTISVRDENTADFVRALSDREPQYNLDPVLIYDFKSELVDLNISKKYLLVYSYSNRICDTSEIQEIKKFAEKHKLQIVGAGVFQYWCDKNIVVSPFELLGYFKNAHYVVTDTFHGAVISIKYNKAFAAFIRKSNEKKLRDLLLRLSMDSRVVQRADELDSILEKDVDYTKTNEILAYARNSAMEYLRKSIEEVKQSE